MPGKTSLQVALILLISFPAIPIAAQNPATDQIAEQRQRGWEQHQQLAATSPFRDLTWHAMGPKFAGGRIESIDAPKGDLATIYLGVGSGGVWKTSNGGLSWKPIFQHQSTFAIGDLTISPADPSVVWVGTGECHVGRMSYSGTGVFKSQDAGETWKHVGLSESFHIGQIAADPKDPQVAYVAAMGSRTSGGQRGIFKTTDGGHRFRQVLKVDPSVSLVDVVIDPSQPDRLFASAWDRSNGNGSGVYRSEDRGETWTKLAGGLPEEKVDRVAIAVSQSSPGVVYALLADRSSPNLARRRPASRLYRSNDFGNNWNVTHSDFVPTYIGWDFCDVRVAPDNADQVYIGGFRFIKSLDGGQTFVSEGGLPHDEQRERAFNDRPESVQRLHPHQGVGLHLDVHDIWVDPVHPQRILMGNDGGLFQSWDHGDTWLHLNNLPIAEFYRIHLDNETPFQIWGGTQDNASFVGPSTARYQTGRPDPWQQVFLDPWSGGDGFSTFPDPNNAEIVYFTQQNGDLKRARRNALDSGRSIRPANTTDEPRLQFAWDTPFFASQHSDETTLYCAAQRVMRSRDRGNRWQSISPDFGDRPILSLRESPRDPKCLVVGDGSGQVHVTTDGGETWTDCAPLPGKRIGNVVPSCHDRNRIYVVCSGRVENDFQPYLYVSNDLGKSWSSLVSNLPTESVNTIVEDPKTPGLLFLGTDLGCYVSTDHGSQWQSLSETLPTAPVLDLQVHGRDGALVAATHGLSLFLLEIQPIRDSLADPND